MALTRMILLQQDFSLDGPSDGRWWWIKRVTAKRWSDPVDRWVHEPSYGMGPWSGRWSVGRWPNAVWQWVHEPVNGWSSIALHGGIYIYIYIFVWAGRKWKTRMTIEIFLKFIIIIIFFFFMSTGRVETKSKFSSNIVENGLNLIWNDALYSKICIGKISDAWECPIRGRITRNGWPDPAQPKPGYDGDDRRRMVIGGEKFCRTRHQLAPAINR